MIKRKIIYPFWLNFASALSIFAAGGGSIAMLWNTTLGAGIAGIGFSGIWVLSLLPTRLKWTCNKYNENIIQ